MKFAITMQIAITSFSSVGAGRLLNKLNQRGSAVLGGRCEIGACHDEGERHDEAEDQRPEHRMDHAARYGAAGIGCLFGGVRRGIEARDRVERVEKADEEGDQRGARRRHISAAGITRVVHEGRETGEVPACAPDQEHRRKHDRDDQDEVAGEICQQRGQLDAEMIDQRLRRNDQGYGTDLHIVGVVIDGIDLVETSFPSEADLSIAPSTT